MIIKKRSLIIYFTILFILFSLVSVSALVGSIGNARVVLRADVGDVIDRTIRVINDNPDSVDITISTSGDLKEGINIIDQNFILEPYEEKEARFTLEVIESGKTETRINVLFQGIDEEGQVGLSSKIIVITEEEEEDNPPLNNSEENPEENNEQENDEDDDQDKKTIDDYFNEFLDIEENKTNNKENKKIMNLMTGSVIDATGSSKVISLAFSMFMLVILIAIFGYLIFLMQKKGDANGNKKKK